MTADVYAIRPGVSQCAWSARVRQEAANKLVRRFTIPLYDLAPDPQHADGTREWGGQWTALTHVPPARRST